MASRGFVLDRRALLWGGVGMTAGAGIAALAAARRVISSASRQLLLDDPLSLRRHPIGFDLSRMDGATFKTSWRALSTTSAPVMYTNNPRSWLIPLAARNTEPSRCCRAVMTFRLPMAG